MSKELTKQLQEDAKIAQGEDEIARLDQIEAMLKEASEQLASVKHSAEAIGLLICRLEQAVMIRRITVLQKKTGE